MNTRLSHIVFLLTGLWILAGAGCTVDVPEKETRETALTFDPVLYASTKTSAGVYPEELPFGVSAWEYDAGETWFGEKAAPFLVNSKITERENAVWMPTPEVFWPGKGQRLTFVAYSPYGAADYIDPVNGVTFANVDVRQDQTDLLYTDPAQDLSVTSSGGMVSLAFRHALCSVSFLLHCREMGFERISVQELSLESLGCVGSFRSLPTPGWTINDTRDRLLFFEGSQPLKSDAEAVGGSLWVIPQFAVARVRARIHYQYTQESMVDETALTDPLGIPLEPGRNYVFSLTYSPETGTLKVDQLEYN